MTQVDEAFTNTTMEKPPAFLDFVQKQMKQLKPPDSSGETVVITGPARGWSRREPVFSGETFVTAGRANVAVTTETIAPGKAWLPQSCRAWGWSHGEPAFSGETLVTAGRAGVAVTTAAMATGKVWLPQNYFVVQQEGGNVFFLFVSYADVLERGFKPEHPIVLELYELLKEDSDDAYEGQVIPKAKSVSHAVIFAKKVLEKVRTNPIIDLHPDGEVSLTWRSNRGIMNIAFREDGVATYAAYLPLAEESHKGRFRVSSPIPINVTNIIDQIEKS
jgi:hypothetical protein